MQQQSNNHSFDNNNSHNHSQSPDLNHNHNIYSHHNLSHSHSRPASYGGQFHRSFSYPHNPAPLMLQPGQQLHQTGHKQDKPGGGKKTGGEYKHPSIHINTNIPKYNHTQNLYARKALSTTPGSKLKQVSPKSLVKTPSKQSPVVFRDDAEKQSYKLREQLRALTQRCNKQHLKLADKKMKLAVCVYRDACIAGDLQTIHFLHKKTPARFSLKRCSSLSEKRGAKEARSNVIAPLKRSSSLGERRGSKEARSSTIIL